MGDDVEPLSGGNLSGSVVRIGNTVRRPTGPWTPAVHSLLHHLEEAGFDGAPRVFGIDDDGREIVEYIDGVVPWIEPYRRLVGTDEAVRRIGSVLRRFHDAVADFVPPDDAVWRFSDMQSDAIAALGSEGQIVCHNDPGVWNLVVGERWAFVDWDTAGPRPPMWDVAYTAISVVPVTPEHESLGWTEPPPYVDRLRALADGYGLDDAERARLPEVIVARVASSYEHLCRRGLAGEAPWDRMLREGHGEAWAAMLRFAEAHRTEWTTALA